MSEELIIPFNIKEPQKRNTKLESAVTIDKIMELPSYQLGTPIWGVSIHYYHRQAEVVFLGQVTKDMITSRLSSKGDILIEQRFLCTRFAKSMSGNIIPYAKTKIGYMTYWPLSRTFDSREKAEQYVADLNSGKIKLRRWSPRCRLVKRC